MYNCSVLTCFAVTNDSSGNMERPTTSSFRGGGTFPYISPEQLDHNRRSNIDAKTDMYSLGIILFDLHYPKEVEGDERSEVCYNIMHNYRLYTTTLNICRSLLEFGREHFHRILELA